VSDAVHTLRAMVRIPSVNPRFEREPAEHTGEAGMARFVAERLDALGFTVDFDEVYPDRHNVCAVRAGRSERAVGLSVHLDTVPTGGMTIDPFAAELRDGRVWGRGSVDTKASAAAALEALKAETADPRAPTLYVLFTCDEETGLGGAAHWVANPRAHPPLVGMVVGEPTDLRCVTLHRGVYHVPLSAAGKAAHASMPERGANAVYRIAHAVTRLEALAEELGGRAPHPKLGTPCLNVGTIEGGTGTNVVPDAARITIDRRLVPGEDARTVRREILSAVEGVEGLSLGEPTFDAPPFAVDERVPFVRAVFSALDQDTGTPAPFATDASQFQAAGVPCVVLGPGESARAHTKDESLAVDELERGVDAYRVVLRAAAELCS